MSDLATLTATAMLDCYARHAFSPVDVVEAVLARAARLEPSLHSFIRIDAEGARAAARGAEEAWTGGRDARPLEGVPVGIKDIIDVAGMATTCHSKLMPGRAAERDATVVRRLREAGAIIMGKLATHEFAIGGPSFDLPFPPARNPWNVDHNPGGSSSGSAAAVAAGLLPVAIGTDTTGSIRHPAGACGVLGLKPSYETVPREGVFPAAYSLDHVGPLARSTSDLGLAFRVMANRPGARSHPRATFGLRVGYVRQFHTEDIPADPAVAAALDAVADRLREEGMLVGEVRLPALLRFLGVAHVIMYAESWAIHAKWLRSKPQEYGRLGRQQLMTGVFLSAEDYLQAQRHRRALAAAVDRAFEEADVLLVANMLEPAPRIDDQEALTFATERQARAPFNLTGHPAVSIVTGVSKDGLPLSGQLVGRMGEEETLLAVCGAWQAEVPIAPM